MQRSEWKSLAIDDLRKYQGYKVSLENIRENLSILADEIGNIKATRFDKVATGGGRYDPMDAWISNHMKRAKLEERRSLTMRRVALIEKGLEMLNINERKVLDLFYIMRPEYRDYVGELSESLHAEKSTIYKLKDGALMKFAIAMYGVPEL